MQQWMQHEMEPFEDREDDPVGSDLFDSFDSKVMDLMFEEGVEEQQSDVRGERCKVKVEALQSDALQSLLSSSEACDLAERQARSMETLRRYVLYFACRTGNISLVTYLLDDGGPLGQMSPTAVCSLITPNWQHHSKKEKKRTLKPQALRSARERRRQLIKRHKHLSKGAFLLLY